MLCWCKELPFTTHYFSLAPSPAPHSPVPHTLRGKTHLQTPNLLTVKATDIRESCLARENCTYCTPILQVEAAYMPK